MKTNGVTIVVLVGILFQLAAASGICTASFSTPFDASNASGFGESISVTMMWAGAGPDTTAPTYAWYRVEGSGGATGNFIVELLSYSDDSASRGLKYEALPVCRLPNAQQRYTSLEDGEIALTRFNRSGSTYQIATSRDFGSGFIDLIELPQNAGPNPQSLDQWPECTTSTLFGSSTLGNTTGPVGPSQARIGDTIRLLFVDIGGPRLFIADTYNGCILEYSEREGNPGVTVFLGQCGQSNAGGFLPDVMVLLSPGSPGGSRRIGVLNQDQSKFWTFEAESLPGQPVSRLSLITFVDAVDPRQSISTNDLRLLKLLTAGAGVVFPSLTNEYSLPVFDPLASANTWMFGTNGSCQALAFIPRSSVANQYVVTAMPFEVIDDRTDFSAQEGASVCGAWDSLSPGFLFSVGPMLFASMNSPREVGRVFQLGDDDCSGTTQAPGSGNDNQSSPSESMSTTALVMTISVVSLTIIVIVIVGAYLYIRHQKQKREMQVQPLEGVTTGDERKPGTSMDTSTAGATAGGDSEMNTITSVAPSRSALPSEAATAANIVLDLDLPEDPADRKQFLIKEGAFQRNKLLGRGANGSVYSAVLADGSSVAMKEVLLPSNAADLREEIQGEINIIKNLHHPNVVEYYGSKYDDVELKLQIFMEIVSAGSLASVARNTEGNLMESIAKVYVRQLVEGLAYIHSKGVVHRDLKCDNVLLTSDGMCKIADFGASKTVGNTVGASRAANTMIGTPFFMAPEILIGITTEDDGDEEEGEQGYGKKADVWSLGITVLEMLNRGNPPWPDFPNHGSAFIHIGSPEGIPIIPDHLSEKCRDFVQQCCQRDPRSRATMNDLLLHPWLEIDDTPYSPVRTPASP